MAMESVCAFFGTPLSFLRVVLKAQMCVMGVGL